MNEITITSQEEFNRLPKEGFDVFTEIVIKSQENIIIKRNLRNSVYSLCNSSSAELYDSSSAKLYNSSSARLWGSSRAELFNSSSAKLYNSSSAELYDSSSAVLWDSSSAVLWDSSSAVLWDSSSAELYDSSSAELFDTSLARATRRHKGRIDAYENSAIIGTESTNKYQLFDNATLKEIKELDISFDTWLERGYVVADGMREKLINQKTKHDITFYETDKGFVARKDNTFAHGNTELEALTDLKYKLSDRDPSAYKSWKLDDIKSKEDLVLAYRVITGACSYGVNNFLAKNKIPEEMKVSTAIRLTKDNYGHEKFREFFNVAYN